MWYVYVLKSINIKFAGVDKTAPTYVGSTTDPVRRLRQHNGEITGGGKYTSMLRPWKPVALFGPYADRSEAFKAEMILKKRNRGQNRIAWKNHTDMRRGRGAEDPWVEDPSKLVPYEEK